MGNFVLVGCLYKSIDAVIDILLDAVVDAALTIAASCSVVIDAQPAATIDELDVEAHGMQLHIILCGFAESSTDAAYLVDLAADMEMNKAQAITESKLVKHL